MQNVELTENRVQLISLGVDDFQYLTHFKDRVVPETTITKNMDIALLPRFALNYYYHASVSAVPNKRIIARTDPILENVSDLESTK